MHEVLERKKRERKGEKGAQGRDRMRTGMGKGTVKGKGRKGNRRKKGKRREGKETWVQ
jgi:hypothetical protein